jgi:hypothetical protein
MATVSSEPVGQEDCPSCGAPIAARYCAECGERRPSLRQYSLRAFAHEAFETLTDVDRSVLATLRSLVTRPGELTAAYMRGTRVPYLRPLQLFLLTNVIYFLWAGWTGISVFNIRYRFQLTAVYGSITRPIGARVQAASGLSPEAFATAFDERSLVLARSMVIALVPLLAAGIGLIQIRRRRPAVHHLVFALHYLTTLLVLTMLLVYVVGYPAALVSAMVPGLGWQQQDTLLAVIMAAAVTGWSAAAFRRAYGDRLWESVLKGVGVVVVTVAALTAFRLVLFLVVTGTM